MKRLILILAAFAVLPLSSCNKIKEAIKVKFPVNMQFELTIPPVPDASYPLQLENIALDGNIDELLKEQNPNLNPKHIRSVYLRTVTLTVDPEHHDAEDNLTAIDYLDVSFSSENDRNPTELFRVRQPEEAFFLTAAANEEVNLRDYFQSQILLFDFKAAMQRETSREIPITVQMKFVVEAGL